MVLDKTGYKQGKGMTVFKAVVAREILNSSSNTDEVGHLFNKNKFFYDHKRKLEMHCSVNRLWTTVKKPP